MILIILVWTLFAQLCLSSTTPNSNSTGEFIGWKGEPSTRGTFSLLSSCLITLTLCVWTAVHLNIAIEKQPDESWSITRRLWNSHGMRRARWVLMGLLAPELVVYTAWRQWSSAKELTQKMQEILSDSVSRTEDEFGASLIEKKQKHEWTLVHSFYAGMGGYVIDISDNKAPSDPTMLEGYLQENNLGQYIPGNRRQLVLTAQGVLFLASTGYDLPSISEETILDRSKADGFAKAIVCLQAGYMMIQCASRLASHLPLSFLEINTLGHVVCALVMYLFWLNKPQDIRTTTHLSDHSIRPLCAYLYMESSMSKAWDGSKREFSMLRYNSTLGAQISKYGASVPAGLSNAKSGETVVTLDKNQILQGTNIAPLPAELRKLTRAEKRELGGLRLQRNPRHTEFARCELDMVGVRRWKLASEFLEQNKFVTGGTPAAPKQTWRSRVADVTETQKFDLETLIEDFKSSVLGAEFVVDEVPNWPHSAGYLSRSFYSTWAAIALAVGLYGGLHISAWNAHFPSFIEQVLWCSSAAIVAASGSLAFILILFDRLPSWGRESFIKSWSRVVTKSGDDNVWAVMIYCFVGFFVILLALPLAVGVVAYVPARLFLVVEAFISLRDMPTAIYQTPDWTQLIPHL